MGNLREIGLLLLSLLLSNVDGSNQVGGEKALDLFSARMERDLEQVTEVLGTGLSSQHIHTGQPAAKLMADDITTLRHDIVAARSQDDRASSEGTMQDVELDMRQASLEDLEKESPELYLEQKLHTTDLQKDRPFTMAVVRPFISRDAQMMLDSMLDQQGGWSKACNPAAKMDPIDLIFYFNADIHQLPDIKTSLAALAKNEYIKQCFNKVRVVAANMPAHMDGYPRGPCNQFFRMFLDQDTRNLFSNYNKIYYMEPDITPLRPYWLDAIHGKAVAMEKSGLWVSGPSYDNRYVPAHMKHSTTAFTDGHINGNSIYSFSNPKYINFLTEAYHKATQNCMWGDYDHRMWGYLRQHRPELHSHFEPTELIAHVKASREWDPNFTLEQALHNYPKAMLIHSRPIQALNYQKPTSAGTLSPI